ncbi:MAG: hypothetical protein AB7H66_06440 [Hyphomonadaceae bacterium]
MARSDQPAKLRAWMLTLLFAALAIVAVAILAPNALAAGVGRMLADLWVTVMGAVTGLLGGVFDG